MGVQLPTSDQRSSPYSNGYDDKPIRIQSILPTRLESYNLKDNASVLYKCWDW
ncbi:hypothetical protein SCLCIDRAFT_1210199 [Scleroderma citrinum Foug A]|uniref:Uncharacterized protein n=1 Tax=Scleroderma citrinum Foug A TaxID=1036808 RepID=A0A0C3A1M1_9AGAM|nr:hypothetical protein SCLCIDRAFT_1210199 [Scleroderma citrinum Foug A]